MNIVTPSAILEKHLSSVCSTEMPNEQWEGKKTPHLLRLRENLFCTIWRKKTVPKWAARSFKDQLFMFDSSELLRIEIGPEVHLNRT